MIEQLINSGYLITFGLFSTIEVLINILTDSTTITTEYNI